MLLALGTIAYYLFFEELGTPLYRRLGAVLAWRGKMSLAAANDVGRQCGVTVAQFGVLLVVLHLAGIPLRDLFHGNGIAGRVGLGLLLGVGEYSVSATLCKFAISVAVAFSASEESDWASLMRSGWMGSYFRCRASIGLPATLVLASIYVLGEEMMFRGAILGSLLVNYGPAPALAGSIGAFVAVQFASMPSVRAAMFPIIGAIVIGVVHGLVYLDTRDLTALCTAHVLCIVLPLIVYG